MADPVWHERITAAQRRYVDLVVDHVRTDDDQLIDRIGHAADVVMVEAGRPIRDVRPPALERQHRTVRKRPMWP